MCHKQVDDRIASAHEYTARMIRGVLVKSGVPRWEAKVRAEIEATDFLREIAESIRRLETNVWDWPAPATVTEDDPPPPPTYFPPDEDEADGPDPDELREVFPDFTKENDPPTIITLPRREEVPSYA